MNPNHSNIPRGIEVLVKKASVDPEFKELVINTRVEAAEQIGLQLDPTERLMLAAVPREQLEAIIDQTTVPQEHRRAFLGKAAAAMLAAVGAMLPAAGLTGELRGCGGASGNLGPLLMETPPGAPVPLVNLYEDLVIDIIAGGLNVPRKDITTKTPFAIVLKADPQKREAIRKGIEKRCVITIMPNTFNGFQTVGEIVDYVETALTVEGPVIDALVRQLKVNRQQVTRDKSLDADLQVTVAKRAALKRKLAIVFRVYLSWDEFKKLQTVDDMIDHVGKAIQKREAAAALKRKSATSQEPASKQMSLGIRPDVPVMGGSGGIRPNPGTKLLLPSSGPVEQAEQLRRRAKEYRDRIRRQTKPPDG